MDAATASLALAASVSAAEKSPDDPAVLEKARSTAFHSLATIRAALRVGNPFKRKIKFLLGEIRFATKAAFQRQLILAYFSVLLHCTKEMTVSFLLLTCWLVDFFMTAASARALSTAPHGPPWLDTCRVALEDAIMSRFLLAPVALRYWLSKCLVACFSFPAVSHHLYGTVKAFIQVRGRLVQENTTNRSRSEPRTRSFLSTPLVFRTCGACASDGW
jgi:hypothetical protein